MNMQQQAQRFGAETVYAEVTKLELEADPKVVVTGEGRYLAKTVVLSTGAGPKMLGLPMEQELTGQGVHYCAACDGMFYRGKTVVVVGGGNSAVADALVLSRLAKKVILIHRRDTLRATKIYHETLMQAENVEFMWNSAVSELLSNGRFTGLRVKNLQTGKEQEVVCDGVFISIGRTPASALVAGQLELDEGGYIIAGESTATSLPGVYAVGDVRTKQVRQIVTAVSDGAVAAHMAEENLAKTAH
jgi:thioredoxin reductase (NADPH)